MRRTIYPRKAAWALSSLVVLGATALVNSVAYASQSGGGGSSGELSFFTVWILGGGGFLGCTTTIPIELLSIATLAEIIRHYMQIQRDKMVPPEVVVELETLLDEEQYEEAINLCEGSKNYLTNIVGAAIARVGEGYDAMTAAAEGATEEENLKLQHNISWLNLFGNLGPMLGLFGTVVGMVVAFSQIASSDTTPSPKILAGGIFTALVTTVWGLIVSMPALTFYFVFKLKVQKLTFELSGVAAEIVERFKPVAEKR